MEKVIAIHGNCSVTHSKFNLSQCHWVQNLFHDMISRKLLSSKGKILHLFSQKNKNKKEMKEGGKEEREGGKEGRKEGREGRREEGKEEGKKKGREKKEKKTP